MKTCLLLLLLALSLNVKAQTSYIEIISHLDMTSQFVFLDIGKAASYYISENGEKVKFRFGAASVLLEWMRLLNPRIIRSRKSERIRVYFCHRVKHI